MSRLIPLLVLIAIAIVIAPLAAGPSLEVYRGQIVARDTPVVRIVGQTLDVVDENGRGTAANRITVDGNVGGLEIRDVTAGYANRVFVQKGATGRVAGLIDGVRAHHFQNVQGDNNRAEVLLFHGGQDVVYEGLVIRNVTVTDWSRRGPPCEVVTLFDGEIRKVLLEDIDAPDLVIELLVTHPIGELTIRRCNVKAVQLLIKSPDAEPGWLDGIVADPRVQFELIDYRWGEGWSSENLHKVYPAAWVGEAQDIMRSDAWVQAVDANPNQ